MSTSPVNKVNYQVLNARLEHPNDAPPPYVLNNREPGPDGNRDLSLSLLAQDLNDPTRRDVVRRIDNGAGSVAIFVPTSHSNVNAIQVTPSVTVHSTFAGNASEEWRREQVLPPSQVLTRPLVCDVKSYLTLLFIVSYVKFIVRAQMLIPFVVPSNQIFFDLGWSIFCHCWIFITAACNYYSDLNLRLKVN